MKYDLVTIEIPVQITVANIEAETGAHAVALATKMVDHIALIDRNTRNYSEDLPAGTVISISSSETPVGGSAQILNAEHDNPSCTYEIASSREVVPATITPRIIVVEAARSALSVMTNACNYIVNPAAKEQVLAAIQILIESGIANTPIDPAEVIFQTDIDHATGESSFPDVQENNDEPEEFLYKRILKLIPNNSEIKEFSIESPIFISTATKNIESEFIEGWSIDFGEVAVIFDGKKIAAIGSWKRFASADLPYFESQGDIDTSKFLLLRENELPEFFTEKPTLPGVLKAAFEIE